LDARGHRTDVPAANGVAVDRADRQNLRAGPAEEHFVRDVELRAIDVALLSCDAKRLATEAEDRIARDALENAARGRRGDRDTVADNEQARGAALGDLALGVQQNWLIVSV